MRSELMGDWFDPFLQGLGILPIQMVNTENQAIDWIDDDPDRQPFSFAFDARQIRSQRSGLVTFQKLGAFQAGYCLRRGLHRSVDAGLAQIGS